MKKFRRVVLVAAFAVMLALAALCFAACSDKKSDESGAPIHKIILKLNEEQVYEEFMGKEGASVTFAKPDPSRPNANFKGWSLSPDGEIVALPTVMPNKDTTYFAVFSRYYNLVLRPGEGTLTDNSNIRAEVGQNLYSLVKDITPTAPGNSTFDGWYYGNKKIDVSADNTMPANTVSLDAKYTVDYTINIYKQANYKVDQYVKVDADTIEGVGFVGNSPRDSEYPTYVGYEFSEDKSGATFSFVLSATNENTFHAYYNLQAFRLVFNPNPPATGMSVSGSMGAAEWGYNVTNSVPACTYAINGYRFSHWSSNPAGDDRLDVGDDYKITDNTTLYAVWTRGFADITGRSYDYIYLVENSDESVVAYLDRYYLDELAGTYDKTTKTVSFKENDKEILRGKLDLDSYTFTYISEQTYVLHELGDSSADITGYLDDTVTLALSADGTATYSENGTPVNGKYAIDSAEQSLKFTADDSGDTFYFRLSQYLTDAGNVDVFEIRSEAEVGEWCRLTDDHADGSDYVDDCYVLVFNGYGEAVMRATTKLTSPAPTTYSYSGYYRYTPGSTDAKPELYVMFITSYDSEIQRITLVDRTATADQDATYKRFYKECKYVVTAYAKPADGTQLPGIADSIQLDGYGLYDDSATFTSGGQTITGKYAFNWTNRTLEFNGTTYFVDTYTVGEGDAAMSFLVYEPIQTGKDELNKLYAIEGLENSFRPGVAYGFRFFNNNAGMLYVIMPDYNSAFNTLNMALQPVIAGTYTPLGNGEYLFQANITAQTVNLIQLYYTELFGFSSGLNLSNFDDFKFKFTGATEGEVTAIGDGYNDISVVYNGATYVTDGYGKARVINEEGIITDTRSYTVRNSMGLPCLYLSWVEYENNANNNPVAVDKQQMYTLIDGEYRAYINEYSKYNTQYEKEIGDTSFTIYIYENDYAVLCHPYYPYYPNLKISVNFMYSWGKVNWADSEHRFGTYEESGVVISSGTLLRYFYGDFKFGLKEVETENSDGEKINATCLFTYAAPSSGVVNGVYVITNEDNSTLTVDTVKGVAEYSVPNEDGGKTTVKGEFKLREGILTIVYNAAPEGDEPDVRSNAFRLVYDDGELTAFLPIGTEAGVWLDGAGFNGSLVLSGEAAEKDGEYIGVWYGYDYETESITERVGTYARTDNEDIVEYEFKFTVEVNGDAEDNEDAENNEDVEGNDTVERSFKFTLGYNAALMPIYRIYSMPAYVELFASMTSRMPSYLLRGGGYTDMVLIDTDNNQTVGQFLIYPNANLLLDDAVLCAFGTNEIQPEPLFFFTIIGEGENRRGVMLDGTFAVENFGRFDIDDGRELTVPVLKDKETNTYVDEKITPDKIFFNGLGAAMLIDTANNRVLPAMYLRYNTNTYAIVSVGKDDKDEDEINIIALMRLYTVTQQVPGEGEDGETVTETRYVVRFDDAELRATFKGEGNTAIITDGFGSATYADERGVLHVCTFARLEDHPEVVVITYLNGFRIVYMYVEVNTQKGTFSVLDADDSRIPSDAEQGEQAGE